MELLTSPEAWIALLTLTALEIVLGIDNVIFLSVIVSRIPERQAKQARQIGLALALVFRILLLSVLVWLIGLTQPVITVKDLAFSWRDIILIGGGMFLIAKATHESEDILMAQCDLGLIDVVRTHWPFMRDRRIDAYGDLTKRYLDD